MNLSFFHSSPSPPKGMKGEFVPLADAIQGFKSIMDGELDDMPEQAFYMIGGPSQIREKAAAMKAEEERIARIQAAAAATKKENE